MNKIIIKNQGKIVAEDLMLVGSSTKRNQTDKIGMFGSGWKYALAWFLRNDIPIEIYSGNERIELSTESVDHRGNDVKVIVINGQKTSLTTDMGPKWTGWMALREVLSNAIDEGNHDIDMKWNPEIELSEDVTQIVIPTNNELSDVMLAYESYFCFNRDTKHIIPGIGRVFIKPEESFMKVYRKGIRCIDEDIHKGFIDIDFDNISINESRLTSSWDISQKLVQITSSTHITLEVLLAFLKSNQTGHLPKDITPRLLELVKELYAAGYNFHCTAVIALVGIGALKENSLLVPSSWWETLESNCIVESYFEKNGGNIKFIRTDSKDVKGIKYYLEGLNVGIEVVVGKFEHQFSHVSIENGKAYVSENCNYEDKVIASIILGCMSDDDFIAYLN